MSGPADIPAASEWEQRYRLGDTPWDKGVATPVLDEVFARIAFGPRVLVPGCGKGHDVRCIAARHPTADVLGLDLAPSAITACKSFPKAGRERYATGDFLALEETLRAAFDTLWEHTLFCAIDPAMRRAYAASARDALVPAGLLAAVFYMDPDHGDGGPPYPATSAELDALFGSHFAIVAEWVPRSAFPGREGRELVRLMRRL